MNQLKETWVSKIHFNTKNLIIEKGEYDISKHKKYSVSIPSKQMFSKNKKNSLEGLLRNLTCLLYHKEERNASSITHNVIANKLETVFGTQLELAFTVI